MPEHPTLSSATTTPKILEAAARFCWHESRNGEECPPEHIPSETDILDAIGLDELPADAIVESEELLKILFPGYNVRWEWIESEELCPLTGGQDEDDGTELHQRSRLAALGWGIRDDQDYYTLPNLEEVHEHWCQSSAKAKHPLVPVVAAWQNRPREIEANDRTDPIFPGPMVIVKSSDSRAGRFFSPAPTGPTANKGGARYFPGFASGEESSGPTTPALPVRLYDLGAGTKNKPERAANLALRVFVEACLSVPQGERKIAGAVLLPPERFGDYLLRLYPNGAKHWRRKRDLGALLEAFEVLESPEARIHWEGLDGTGGARRVVIPRDIPRNGKMDDWVQFVVDLPPSSDRGPLIDRPALIRAGGASAARYRLILGLSFWWYDPGRLQRPVANGGPWVLPRDGQRYPEVSDELLVAMTFPTGDATGATYRQRLHRAKESLDRLVAEGFAAIASKRRIYPGPKWAGWGTVNLPE